MTITLREKERGMSVFASLLHVEYQGNKLNVIDTPGYPDFTGEVAASLHVLIRHCSLSTPLKVFRWVLSLHGVLL